MTLRHRVVTAVGPTITFYATRPDAVGAVHDALGRFTPSLPNGVALTMVPAE